MTDEPAKTWRDAVSWAEHAMDAGVDCPVCDENVIGLGALGDLADAMIEHLKTHAKVIDGIAIDLSNACAHLFVDGVGNETDTCQRCGVPE